MNDHACDLEKTLAIKNDDITTLEENNSNLKRNLEGDIILFKIAAITITII